jgi:hypothetical protein
MNSPVAISMALLVASEIPAVFSRETILIRRSFFAYSLSASATRGTVEASSAMHSSPLG